MTPSSRDLLRRLGAGDSIDSICNTAGWSRAEFDDWWRHDTTRRAPRCEGSVAGGVQASVTIERDRHAARLRSRRSTADNRDHFRD